MNSERFEMLKLNYINRNLDPNSPFMNRTEFMFMEQNGAFMPSISLCVVGDIWEWNEVSCKGTLDC